MKNFIIMLVLLGISTNIYSQDAESNTNSAPVKPQIPLFQFFHMYFEYGSGELDSPLGQRILENLDTKLTYNQNFDKARWLSVGFVAQVTWGFGVARIAGVGGSLNPDGTVTMGKLATPTSWDLAATVGFLNNIFTIGVSPQGTISSTLYYNKVLPKVAGLYSHDITILIAPSFFMLGNQYKNGILAQSWFDKLEVRFAYRMKFASWIGIRPEFLFNITGTDLHRAIQGSLPFKNALMFRFNPRLQFFFEDFSFFIEPRLFWIGNSQLFSIYPGGNGSEFQWEIKVGFDITKFKLR